MNLYEIEHEISRIEYAASSTFPDDNAQLRASFLTQLRALKLEKNQKVGNLGRFVLNLEAWVVSIQNEQRRLAEKKRVTENRIDNLKHYLGCFVEPGGKFDDGIVRVSFRKSESVEVDNPNLVPDQYKIQTFKLDKAGMKVDLKNGAEIPGVRLKENKNLQVK